jgi:hypothetical protein
MRSHRLAPLIAGAVLAASASTALALPAGWNAPERLSPTGVAAYEPWSAANASGDVVVAWRARSRGAEVVQVRRRKAGATRWGAPVTIGPPRASVQGVRVAIDDAGRVLVGWRTRAVGSPAEARAALISRSGKTVRVFRLGAARDASGAVNVAIVSGDQGAVVWTAPGPRSVNNPARRLGRARISLLRGAAGFGPSRLLDRSARPREGFCADDLNPAVAPGLAGTMLAWWDCAEDIRDYRIEFARISGSGVLGLAEDTGTLSRGPTVSTLVDSGSGATLGILRENNDVETGDQLRRITRSSPGVWTQSRIPVAGVSPDDFNLPFVLGVPRLAREPGGATLAAWLGATGEVWASAGPSGTEPLGAAVQIGAPNRFTTLAGVGVTTNRSLLTAWAARTAAGRQERTVWSVLRLAADVAFPAPVDSLRVPILVGEPSLALGTGGRGVIAFSQGPKARASVRASTLALP